MGNLWRFCGEVLFQTKVIRDKPFVGLGHAFLFWGFCLFPLVGLAHLLQGFGINLLGRENQYGVFYYWFAFLFAACGTVAILGLTIRRYIAGQMAWDQ